MLNPVALAGGAFYYDAGGDDARLTIENMLDAAGHGGAVANYVEVDRFVHAERRITAAAMRDRLGDARFELRARLFVNAAGPWIDDVRRLDDPAAAPSVRLTKGVHLVIHRKRLPVREALVLGDAHGRIVFVIPHGEEVLVGTTDTDFDGDRERVAAEPEDLDLSPERGFRRVSRKRRSRRPTSWRALPACAPWRRQVTAARRRRFRATKLSSKAARG